ncbi:unnamed protein product [Didymodactylos carnosus]|uniref:Uncharacterized protein n=1 Tax=Didymodactylos carnosus TaxID=1234261 RepID=A0A813VS52_9BILA|nr:unnamed protein product [Didymodactylos carnosus]CAF1288284.1 unnamed protein product [Didymodactylos carnosus]CAF3635001.1 unnamed protein product [Didymodactylos carnosus]CAF4093279.1 unnamed protein product [Didymodactylos carnosus]
MVPIVVYYLIALGCITSTVVFYVYWRKRSSLSGRKLSSETQKLHYSIKPTIEIVAKRLSNDLGIVYNEKNGTTIKSTISNRRRSSAKPTLKEQSEIEVESTTPSFRECQSLALTTTRQGDDPIRSSSIQGRCRNRTVTDPHTPYNWRYGSISINPETLEFSVPKRRRSVATVDSVRNCFCIEPEQIQILQVNNDYQTMNRLSLKIIYTSQQNLQITFDKFHGSIGDEVNQQLTIKIKLMPDGKEKYCIKKNLDVETKLIDECVIFTNVLKEKLGEKSLIITITSDKRKKTNYGQIEVMLNELHLVQDKEYYLQHEIEKKKTSSIEVLVSMKKKDRYLSVELERIKGIKVDQKHPEKTFYIQTLLLDRYKLISTRRTKPYHMNQSTMSISELYDFSLYGLNIDRLMVVINFYRNEQLIAQIKVGSPLYCSGTGAIHWNQLLARQSFSMWHAMSKQV